MKHTQFIRRKNILKVGISESLSINLAQRSDYFKGREGLTSLYTPYDTLLACIAQGISDLELPFRAVNEVLNCLSKHYKNLYGLLGQNPEQFLALEKDSQGRYMAFPVLNDSLRVFNWDQRKGLVLLNLKPIFGTIKDIFGTEAIHIKA